MEDFKQIETLNKVQFKMQGYNIPEAHMYQIKPNDIVSCVINYRAAAYCYRDKTAVPIALLRGWDDNFIHIGVVLLREYDFNYEPYRHHDGTEGRYYLIPKLDTNILGLMEN